MRLTMTGLTILMVLTLSTNASAQNGVCETAEDVANLPPGYWCEVPDSQLRAVEKKPSEFDDWNGNSSQEFNSFQRSGGVNNVTDAWNSAAFDTTRNCLMATGGGHNDYGGNEVYRFCLDNLQWSRVTDPTPFPNRDPAFQNDDGTPVSRHTYGGLAYLSSPDQFFVFDGAPDSGTGACGTRGTWTYDLTARDTAGDYSPSQWELRTTNNEPERSCDNASAYDVIKDNVIFKSSQGTYTYNFYDNSWSRVSGTGRRNNEVALAVHTDRRTLVEVGGGVTALWSIDKGFSGGVVSTSGPGNIENGDDPGLVYDVRSKQIVGWNGGGSVYTFDIDSRRWTEVPPAEGNVVDPGPVNTTGGVYGRFNYSPELNVYMYVGRVDRNVMLYRLGEGGSLVAPLPPTDFGPNQLD